MNRYGFLAGAAVAATLLAFPVTHADAAKAIAASALKTKAAALVNKPIKVSGTYGGSGTAFTSVELEAGYSKRNMVKITIGSATLPILWAKSGTSTASLRTMKTGTKVLVAGKIRKKKLSSGVHHFFLVDRIEPAPAKRPAKKGGGGSFATARAAAPKSMSFVAARRLAIHPEEYIDEFIATEARFSRAYANLGDDTTVEDFPPATTIRLETSELPFPTFLEKKEETVKLIIELAVGTPIALWGRLTPRAGGSYALVAIRFDVPAGRKKPKTK